MCSYVQQTDYRRLPDPFGTQHRRWEIIEICIIEEQTKREILEVGPMGWEIEERTDEGERKLVSFMDSAGCTGWLSHGVRRR